jgi:hypothetical protein
VTTTRTIVSALYPVKYWRDLPISLKVWFEELPGPGMFLADPFDCERHGQELWFRAMAGEYGPVTLVDFPIYRPFKAAPILSPPLMMGPPRPIKLLPPPQDDQAHV